MRHRQSLIISVATIIAVAVLSSNAITAVTRGINVNAKDFSGLTSRVHMYDRMIAVVIGIDVYRDMAPKDHLSYAVKDARGVEEVLRGNYAFDRIISLYDRKATRNEIMKVLQGDLANTGPDDAVFVYFAGHGVTRPVHTGTGELGYLIPYDGSLDRDKMHRNISMQQIRADVCPLIPAKHLFFVMDACFGGLLLDQRAADVSPVRDAAYLREVTGETVRQVLTAGQADETVLDGGSNGHSVFTGRFIAAIDGVKDYVTARELMAKVSRQVYGDALTRGHRQRPCGGEIYGTGDFVFVSNYEEKLQARLSSAGEELKKARENGEALSRRYERLLEDEKQLQEKTQHVKQAAQQREMEREKAVLQAKKIALAREKASADEELQRQVEIAAALEKEAKEREHIKATIGALEDDIAGRYEELEREKTLQLAKIEQDKEAETRKTMEIMAKIREKRAALDNAKLQTMTVADAIRECQIIKGQIEETEARFNERIADAVRNLEASCGCQKKHYSDEIWKLEGIMNEYEGKIADIAAKYYEDPPGKDMFETEAQYRERLLRHKKDADRKAAESRKEFESSLKSIRAQRDKYAEARAALSARCEQETLKLKNEMGAEKKRELSVYSAQLEDIRKQSFVIPMREVELQTYRPEDQTFCVTALVQINDLVKSLYITLKIAANEARVLWKNREFVRGNATFRIDNTFNDVAVTSCEIIDDVSGRNYDKKSIVSVNDTNSIGMKFALVPAGTFMMGSPTDETGLRNEEMHRVTITQPFYLQTTEVTQGQWVVMMGNNPSRFKRDDNPVESVTWNEAQEFIGKLNRKEGTDRYRLPTEAEWEYACRAGSKSVYCFGDDRSVLGAYAWYGDNSSGTTHPAGTKKPNAWGLYDMHGNVREWCEDWYGEYHDETVTDPTGARSGTYRVLRGGSWAGYSWNERIAHRGWFNPDSRSSHVGFRVVRAR